MDDFTTLFTELDGTTKTNRKLKALLAYFKSASDTDVLWAVWLLSGNTLRRAVTTTQLKDWAAENAGIPRWLFDEGYIRVGDLGETVSLVLRQTNKSVADKPLTDWMLEIAELRQQPDAARRDYIEEAWRSLNQPQRFIFSKLITGSFRVGVSRGLTVRALAEHLDIDAPTLLHALTGNWDPRQTTLHNLQTMQGTDIHPYPFYLASPIGQVEQLGDIEDWQFEWKWDGIRGQLLRRDDNLALWSRGEELVSEQFPEIMAVAEKLPDGTVIDGEIMPWRDGPLPFAVLQTRLGRKVVSDKLQQDAPVSFVTYDLLEYAGEDLRAKPLQERRKSLERLVAATPGLELSPLVTAKDWNAFSETQAKAREHKAEGLMVKRKSSPYLAGRVRGDWWKWKVAPLTIDAVMVNAQRGHGRRSGVYSDYTFAVYDGDTLVPFAKAYSGLTDSEINRVDAFVKRHTLEKFGPVRTVEPKLVFEIGFEGIAASKRHKSGVAVRFPRILRWREDKPLNEIDTVETLQRLLEELS